MSDDEAIRVLARASRVVVAGATTEPGRLAFDEPRFLAVQGWDVVAVTDEVEVLFGQRTYPALEEVPVPLEIVAVYDEGDAAVEQARSALEAGTRALWFPAAEAPAEVERLARERDVPVVDRMLLREAHVDLYGSGEMGQRRREGVTVGSPTRLALAPGWNDSRQEPGTE